MMVNEGEADGLLDIPEVTHQLLPAATYLL
jgi:hypothetical protein